MAGSVQVLGGGSNRTQSAKVSSAVRPTTVPASLASQVSVSGPAPTSFSPVTSSQSNGGYNVSGGSYTANSAGGGGAAASAATPVVPSQSDFLASDATFQNQQASLVKALADYMANQGTEKSQYNVDFGNSQKSLGYDPTSQQWNMTDLNTASGKANEDQENDYAGRGLLQSSLYANAKNDLLRSLGTQETNLETSKQNYMDNLANQLTAYQNQNQVSQQQAQADAIARYAAQYAGLS